MYKRKQVDNSSNAFFLVYTIITHLLSRITTKISPVLLMPCGGGLSRCALWVTETACPSRGRARLWLRFVQFVESHSSPCQLVSLDQDLH